MISCFILSTIGVFQVNCRFAYNIKAIMEYFQTGSISDIQAKHQRKLRMLLTTIDIAQEIDNINLPSFKLPL